MVKSWTIYQTSTLCSYKWY